MKRFLDKWRNFQQRVLQGKDVSPVITENYRRCFYAGAIATLSLIETTDLSKPDEGLEQMRSLMGELNEFGKEVMNYEPEEKPQQREFAPRRKEF